MKTSLKIGILSIFLINPSNSSDNTYSILGGGGVDHFARNRIDKLYDIFLTNHTFTINDTIQSKHVGFGQDMDGNEIWAVSEFSDNKVYIIPNGTFSEMKAAINNVITLKDINDIYGIACKDKDWYILGNKNNYYKFQIKQSNGKYSIDKWQSTSDPFPYDSIENWRWDGNLGNGLDDNSYIITKKYPNNITFEASYSKFKYNDKEIYSSKYNDKEIYSSGDIYGFCYNQKGRIMICQKWITSRLVLVTIPELLIDKPNFAELYWKDILGV